MFRSAGLIFVSALALSACGQQGGGSSSRTNIRIVGSSTVYPFATSVAESFAKKNPSVKTPVVESTGTGAGMKLFCAGVGGEYPDIEDASRRMKASEYADCAKNNVKEIAEIQIGIDGIVFAEAKSGPAMSLTPLDIYKALAATPFGKPNVAKTWKDVNAALPATPILVYGPPTTSGTRDALAELILKKGCDTDPAMKALKDSDKDKHKAVCTVLRNDGAYVDTGENDNLIVQKISGNANALGIFGYSFLEANLATINGVRINGIAPTYDAIAGFSYPGARPLYIYVKTAHLKAIPGLKDYVAEFSRAWGPDGYLKKRGLIVAPDAVRLASAATATAMTPLDPASLK
jgi:phosphate transport system substrate-binding protein